MAADMFAFLPKIGGATAGPSISYVLSWVLVWVIIFGGILFLFFFGLHMKRSMPVEEIDMITKKIKRYRARIRKDKDGNEELYIGRYNKSINRPQQQDLYLKGKKEVLKLLKDNNGFLHTLRIPNYEELNDFYTTARGVNLDDDNQKDVMIENETPTKTQKLWRKYFRSDLRQYKQKIRDIYFLPNPHEDLDWAVKECADADREYVMQSWYNSPFFTYVGVGFVCFLMIVVTLLFKGKL